MTRLGASGGAIKAAEDGHAAGGEAAADSSLEDGLGGGEQMWPSLLAKLRLSAKAHVAIAILLVFVLYFNGVIDHIVEVPFERFAWPPFVDVKKQVALELTGRPSDVLHVNSYAHRWLYEPHTGSPCRLDFHRRAEGGEPPVRLRVFVKSAGGNFGRRAAIRSTWGRAGGDFTIRWSGSVTSRNNYRVHLTFAVASPPGAEDRDRLQRETATFGDTLWMDIDEHYHNNTMKMLSIFDWLVLYSESCVNFQYLLLIDDDYFLSFANLLRLLETVEAESGNQTSKSKHLYMGFRFETEPFRYRWIKHYVPLSQYPFNAYPPYITGGAVLLSAHTARCLALGSRHAAYYPYDDVYLGMVAYLLGIPAAHNEQFVFWPRPYSNASYSEVVAAHGFDDALVLRTAVDNVPCDFDRKSRALVCD